MIYNLKITTTLNRKLLEVISSLVPLKIAESLQFKTIPVFKLFTNQDICLQINMEHFFVYFCSKRKLITRELNINKMQIFQNFLWTNEQKVTGKPEFLDSGHKSWMLNSGRWTLDAERWTLDAWLWILDSGHWTLDAGLWTLDAGLWTLDSRRWTLDAGHCTLDAER